MTTALVNIGLIVRRELSANFNCFMARDYRFMFKFGPDFSGVVPHDDWLNGNIVCLVGEQSEWFGRDDF